MVGGAIVIVISVIVTGSVAAAFLVPFVIIAAAWEYYLGGGDSDAAAVVLTGSHIDTQPSGGKFDGNYGVLAGLEVLRTLNDAGIVTEHPVAVAIWTNEEGSRFVPVMGGSGAFAGVYTLEHLLQQRAGGRIKQLAQTPRRGRLRAPLGQDLPQPVLEAIAGRAAQAAGERAVRLGGIREGALRGEQLLHVAVIRRHHVKRRL